MGRSRKEAAFLLAVGSLLPATLGLHLVTRGPVDPSPLPERVKDLAGRVVEVEMVPGARRNSGMFFCPVAEYTRDGEVRRVSMRSRYRPNAPYRVGDAVRLVQVATGDVWFAKDWDDTAIRTASGRTWERLRNAFLGGLLLLSALLGFALAVTVLGAKDAVRARRA